MVQGLAVRERRGLAKIDEPHASAMAVIMHEEERAADHLRVPHRQARALIGRSPPPSSLTEHRHVSLPLLPRAF